MAECSKPTPPPNGKPLLEIRIEKLEEEVRLLKEFVALCNRDVSIKYDTVLSASTSIPFSSKSSAGIDLDALVKQVEDNPKPSTQRIDEDFQKQTIPAIKEFEDFIQTLFGKDGLLMRYLSPAIMKGGKGFIKPNNTFLQYEDSIKGIFPIRLKRWPSGFYKDSYTKEIQLLINTTEYLFVFKKLPGLNMDTIEIAGMIEIYSSKNDDNQLLIFDSPSITKENLKLIYDNLKDELGVILDTHFF